MRQLRTTAASSPVTAAGCSPGSRKQRSNFGAAAQSPGHGPGDPKARAHVSCHRTGATDMLKLRSLGLDDFSVLEGRQRIGRIRLATERMPCL